MRKILAIFLVVLFVSPVLAQLNFEDIHENLQTIQRISSQMERLSSLYQEGKIVIDEEEFVFSINQKLAIKNKWIALRTELKQKVSELP